MIITIFHKKIKTIVYESHLKFCICYNLIIEYLFYFIEIKNNHKKLYSQLKNIFIIDLL
jgi:hypothetical protein